MILFLLNCGFFFKNGGMLSCSLIFCKFFFMLNFLLVIILLFLEIFDIFFFFESKLRKLFLEIICLLDMDFVYNCEMNMKFFMELILIKDFNVFVDL